MAGFFCASSLLLLASAPVLASGQNLMGSQQVNQGPAGSFLQTQRTNSLARTQRKRRSHAAGENLVEYKDSGSRIKSSVTAAESQRLADSMTPDQWGAELKSLIAVDDSRYSETAGAFKAEKHVLKVLSGLGLKPIVDKYSWGSLGGNLGSSSLLEASQGTRRNPAGNVFAVQEGTDLKHEYIVLGAHYDSVNWENTKGVALGADDNGSGTASVLQIARVLASTKPRRSVVYALFTGEEDGLKGSQHFVEKYVGSARDSSLIETHGDNYVGLGPLKVCKNVLILDEVGFAGKSAETDHRAIFETKGKSPGNNAMIDTLARNAGLESAKPISGSSLVEGDTSYGVGLRGVDVNYDGFGSDHMSWLERGYDATLLIERDDELMAKLYGHSARDTFANINTDFGNSMARLAMRTVLDYASPL